MPKKPLSSIEEVLAKSRATAQKTERLVIEARNLHGNSERAHDRAKQLREQIKDKRERARSLRERKH